MVIDVYCERTGMELLSEPLNAFSNISFLIAALAAWRLAISRETLPSGLRALIALGFSVGIGSILWHTYPNDTTLILDVVPIVLFIIWFIWLHTRNVIGISPIYAIAAVLLFLAATYFAMSYAHLLHGAPVYTPGLLVVLTFGLYQAVKRKTVRFTLLLTAGVYFTALFFRTIDQELCSFVPVGTHFIWHSLIGLVTYMAMRALILSYPSKGSSRPAEKLFCLVSIN